MRNRLHWVLSALLCGLAGFVLSLGAAGGAVPLEGDDIATDNVTARLVSETSAIVPGETFYIALHLDIREHWHTYWRFAGDSGAATTVDLSVPEGFSAGEMLWPYPEAVPLGPLMNFGYETEAFHIIPVTAPSNLAPGETAKITAAAEWLVCSDEVCIPEWGDLSLSLPVARAGMSVRPNDEWGPRIARAMEDVPAPAPFDVTYAQAGEHIVLALQAQDWAVHAREGTLRDARYFPFDDGIIQHAGEQAIAVSESGISLQVPGGHLASADNLPEVLQGVVVLTDADGTTSAFEIAAEAGAPLPGGIAIAPVAGQPAGPASGTPLIGALTALVFAFLGGLILNLMPCVFPVLSMKVLGFVNQAQVDARALRHHGWLFTAGVLASFAALAALLLILRAGGAFIGWGFQLQSPLMVLALAYLMFVVGLSLSGVIAFGGGFAGAGDRLTRKPGPAGAFFTGVLAALVATPCTAPFMGAAMGYAVVAPALVGVLVFLALGAGLAAPYLALSYFPGAFGWLPKPGAWMDRLKEFLAFPMYGAAAWLIWVFAQQSGTEGLFAALVGVVLIAFAAWLLRLPGLGGRWVPLSRAVAFVALAAALVAPGLVARNAQEATPAVSEGGTAASTIPSETYTEAALAAAKASGRPTFVYLTAAWCVTCKVNERFVLASRRVQAAFSENNVLILKGDWTERDEKITQLLSSYGRAGVPLYLYFDGTPGASAQILPQILTENGVISVIEGNRSRARNEPPRGRETL